MRRMKIRTKLTIWYTSTLIMIIFVFSFFVYLLMLNTLQSSEINYIQAFSDEVISRIHFSDSQNSKIKISESHKIINSGGQFIVYSVQKKPIFQTSSLFTREVKKINFQDSVRKIRIEKKDWLIYDQPLYDENNKLIAWVRVGRPIDARRFLQRLKMVMIISIPLPFLISLIGGYLLTKRAFDPIDHIIKTARMIGQGNLSQRLNMPRIEDEIGMLAMTFDEMLDKLESAFKKERQFTSNASHQLRTPISAMRALVEDALAYERTGKEYKEILELIYNEIIKMNTIVSQLLMLSRADENNYKLEIENVDLEIVIEDVIEEMKEKANKSNIRLDWICEDKIIIRADQTLITQLLLNLIDNAIKYNKKNGWVRVLAIKKDEKIHLIIEDGGIGISQKDLPYIFNRFYRGDKVKAIEGTGLGLSIVEWIVKIHKGQIDVKSSENIGTKIEVILPLSSL